MIPLYWYLVVSTSLFCIGLFGVLTRKNAIAILMGVELMLNAVNINLIAFWRYFFAVPTEYTDSTRALAFVAIVFVAAAAEAAVGLALIISAYRKRETVAADELDTMKG